MDLASTPEPAAADPGIRIGVDARKLTVYFGERTRDSTGAYVADLMVDLFGRHGVATSVLLRGVEGFGLRHHLRTDQTLSLSEDPPVVAVAVDATSRIDALLAEMRRRPLPGLVTLERAQLVVGGPGPLRAPADPHEAVKLTVYVGRQERVSGVPAHIAVCDLMRRRGLAGASVFLGVDGTAYGRRQRARFFGRNADVPLMIIAVGDGARVCAVVPELDALLERPLFTVERIRVCKRDGALLERPHELPATDPDGLAMWQKIMVFGSDSTLHHGVPIHRALVRALRAAGAARGATSVRGIWGFHGDHEPHGDRPLQVRRRVPVATVVVDEPERMARAFELIDEITGERGLVTSEMVPALVSDLRGRRSGGFRLARRAN